MNCTAGAEGVPCRSRCRWARVPSQAPTRSASSVAGEPHVGCRPGVASDVAAWVYAHATLPPVRLGTCPHAQIFPGFVQFSVLAFRHPLFSRKSQRSRIRHFAQMPEVPTATSDLTGGTPRRPRTQAATVRKRARLYRRLRVSLWAT